MATTKTLTHPTPHGTLSYTLSNPVGPSTPSQPTILLIHGNSSSAQIFRPILNSRLPITHPILTVDLPGHGSSANSPTPSTSYTMPGYAAAIAHLLASLSLPSIMILGWSLGGHIALELLVLPTSALGTRILGIMIIGTPPVGPDEVPLGFLTARADPASGEGDKSERGGGHINIAATAVLTEEQIDAFARGTTARYEPWMRETVARTDGRAREIMWTAFERGEGVDQRKLVGETKVLTAVVNGAGDPFVDLKFVKEVKYGRLWGREVVELEGLGHAPFWEDWERFKGVMGRWVEDCEREEGTG